MSGSSRGSRLRRVGFAWFGYGQILTSLGSSAKRILLRSRQGQTILELYSRIDLLFALVKIRNGF
jgi:hypothetical protein